MKYTKCFSEIIKLHGQVNLKEDHLRCMFNIVHLEAKLSVYTKLNKNHQYVRTIFEMNELLKTLTENMEPKELIKSWYSGKPTKRLSQNDYPGNTEWDEHDPYLA
jgi:hypothetical protein